MYLILGYLKCIAVISHLVVIIICHEKLLCVEVCPSYELRIVGVVLTLASEVFGSATGLEEREKEDQDDMD